MQGRSQDNSSSSVLSYTPLTSMDFGTIMCTASNMVGPQRKPCVFHIIMAGRRLVLILCTRDDIMHFTD